MFQSAGTVPDILGVVVLSLRPNSGSNSKIAGRILTLWFLIHGLWPAGDRRFLGSGRPQKRFQRWGGWPPTTGNRFVGLRGRPDPKHIIFPAGPTKTCLKNQRVGANYWKLNLYLRAKLERLVFGAVWLVIWCTWGSFRPLPGRLRPIF